MVKTAIILDRQTDRQTDRQDKSALFSRAGFELTYIRHTG